MNAPIAKTHQRSFVSRLKKLLRLRNNQPLPKVLSFLPDDQDEYAAVEYHNPLLGIDVELKPADNRS